MMLLEEIRSGFANLQRGTVARLSALPQSAPGWIFVEPTGAFGVAIDTAPGVIVNETFSGAQLFSFQAILDGLPRLQVRLQSTHGALRNEFAVVCAQFLEPGEQNRNRIEVSNEPLAWWQRWRQLLGNAVREKAPHAVLGELLVLERLWTLGETPTWTGPTGGTHDLECLGLSCEVKSTVSRYSSEITVSGQFQLSSSASKPLFLVFCRFEPRPNCETIDLVAQRLSRFQGLSENLVALGYRPGSQARQASFALLDALVYKIDGQFPKIMPSSFVGGTLPKGITAISYQVDLAVLQGRPWPVPSLTDLLR
ncbi:MAG: PD-(D/E)XK motif protein [Archangium sp.]|nr:PD-(D/E)XK motif protein [Archangium sp.]